MTPYQIQKLLAIRKAVERELEAMATSPSASKAVASARDVGSKSKGPASQFRAAQSSIRMVEGLDQVLYSAGRIKKLPKPKYPGGKRV